MQPHERRDWMEDMRAATAQFLGPLLSPPQAAALPELVSYLQDSFGNATRIDYGTGGGPGVLSDGQAGDACQPHGHSLATGIAVFS